MKRNSALGFFFIGIGVLMLLGQTRVIGGNFFLYALSLGFIAIYAMFGGRSDYGNLGWLIPGSVLLFIALFSDLETYFNDTFLNGSAFFLFLAAAFGLVYLVHTRAAGDDWGSKHWPLFPILGLVLFTAFIELADNLTSEAFNLVIAAALIVVGIYMMTRSRRK